MVAGLKKKERYRTGSYNEIAISKFSNWTKKNIYNRGFDMLKFLEIKVTGLRFTEGDMKKVLFFDDYIIQRFD